MFRYIKVAKTTKKIVSSQTRPDPIELPPETGEYVWFDVSGLQYKDANFDEMELTSDYDILIDVRTRDSRLQAKSWEARRELYPGFEKLLSALVAAEDGNKGELEGVFDAVRIVNEKHKLPAGE